MSVAKNQRESYRWMRTALDDLRTARILKEHSQFAHSCFHAQQAGEKALKALWFFHDADPWGHSLKKLLDELDDVDQDLYEHCRRIHRQALVLDRYYIPTRYPNGLPDITPDLAFEETDAASCLEHAQQVVDLVADVIEYQ